MNNNNKSFRVATAASSNNNRSIKTKRDHVSELVKKKLKAKVKKKKKSNNNSNESKDLTSGQSLSKSEEIIEPSQSSQILNGKGPVQGMSCISFHCFRETKIDLLSNNALEHKRLSFKF